MGAAAPVSQATLPSTGSKGGIGLSEAHDQEVGGSNPSPRTRSPIFIWGQQLGRDECPYLKRWVLDVRLFSLRVHHWFSSDDDRAKHDHPWWFITLVLKGGYTDLGEDSIDKLGPGSVRYRESLHRHTVQVNPGGCWTLMLSGPKKRYWGFWVPRKSDGLLKFMKSNKYFLTHGHHPCE